MGECSKSTVSHGKPTRAKRRVASTFPNDSHVPTCGFPALRAAFTGFRFIRPTPSVRHLATDGKTHDWPHSQRQPGAWPKMPVCDYNILLSC